MRRPKLPASTHFRCLRPHQGFNGGIHEHPTSAEHVSGARPVTYSCLSSPQQRATRQRKPSTRPMLHNATPGPRGLPMMVSPSSGRSSRGKSLTRNLCWKWGRSCTEQGAGPLRQLHPSAPRFARISVPPPLDHRKYHGKHAPVSYKYLRDSLLQSPPSADEVVPTNDSTVVTPQAEARTPQPRRKTRRSKTILDYDVTSHPQMVGSEVRRQIVRKHGETAIKPLIERLWRANISRAKFSDANKLSGVAVVIFLRRTGPDDSHVSDIFKRAAEVFDQEQLVEVTIPRGRAPHWAPPEIDKIRIEGEENAAVPVFDSCDEVRAKINSYLRQPDGPGPWQFCCVLQAQLKATTPKSIFTFQLKRFMAHDGPFSGAGGVVYYAAYIFFEKLRIAEGRPKSSHRLEMERLYPRGIRLVTPKSKNRSRN